jgi:hypothetical protein
MEYDYERYCEIQQAFMEAAWIDRHDLVIGENVSDMPEIKIIFDGHGDLEETDEHGEYVYTERGNKNMESYAIFLHKDSLKEDFVFPEHETAWNMIVHRPKEEVCLYAWYDVEQDSWDFIQLEDRLDQDNTMNENDVMEILEGLYNKYFKPLVDLKTGEVVGVKTGWPFPTGEKP